MVRLKVDYGGESPSPPLFELKNGVLQLYGLALEAG